MKNRLLVLSISLLVVLGVAAQKLYQFEGTVKQAYNFWLYTPDGYESSDEGMPLVIFLHGKSLSGSDLSKVRKYGPLSALSYGRNINSLIMAPQSPGDGWKPEKVNRLLDWAIENFHVDTSRVYIVGMSMGGYGTIDYVGTYPQRVTAAIAMCGGTTLKSCDKMVDVPLWIIHGTDDKAVPVSASDKVYAAIREAKADNQCHYDRLAGVNHASLARMFYMNETYDWLFSHTAKGKKNTIQPTFNVTAKLPNAYKGLQSNSVSMTILPGRVPVVAPQVTDTVAAPAKPQPAVAATPTKPQPAATTTPAPAPAAGQSDAAKATAERLAKEKAAQEKAEQDRIAREKAAKLAAEKKAAAEAAAKKKAAEEAAAKKKAAEEAKKKAAEEAARKKAAEEAAKWHVVKSGESFWSIASKNGLTVDELRKLNGMTDKSVLHPGDKIRVKK